MESRPHLDVDNLSVPASLTRSRKAHYRSRLSPWTKEDKQRLYRILYTFRRKQRDLTDENVEDPDPYDPTYVFYCLST